MSTPMCVSWISAMRSGAHWSPCSADCNCRGTTSIPIITNPPNPIQDTRPRVFRGRSFAFLRGVEHVRATHSGRVSTDQHGVVEETHRHCRDPQRGNLVSVDT